MNMEAAATGSDDAIEFVVFSDDWGVHPSSSQHIFRHIAERYPVAWINTVGMRRPRLEMADARKAVRKLGNMLRRGDDRRAASMPAKLSVHQPAMVPLNDIGAVRRFNRRSVERTLRAILSRPAGGRRIVVTTVPNSCDYVAACASPVVYYCVDDFSEWPGLDKTLILDMERELVARADAFVATSTALHDKLAATGKPTTFLSHGVDLEHFATEAEAALPLLADIPEPRVGYFGLFDERSDQDLLLAVARANPGLSFVIAGRVETETERLRAADNVHFTGLLDYADLPAFVRGMRALFLPYRDDRLAESLSPLKMKEYLVTGRPVISTPIPAARELAGQISLARDVTEWSNALQAALETDIETRRRQMRKLMAEESWQRKAEALLEVCRDVLDRPREGAARVAGTGS